MNNIIKNFIFKRLGLLLLVFIVMFIYFVAKLILPLFGVDEFQAKIVLPKVTEVTSMVLICVCAAIGFWSLIKKAKEAQKIDNLPPVMPPIPSATKLNSGPPPLKIDWSKPNRQDSKK